MLRALTLSPRLVRPSTVTRSHTTLIPPSGEERPGCTDCEPEAEPEPDPTRSAAPASEAAEEAYAQNESFLEAALALAQQQQQ